MTVSRPSSPDAAEVLLDLRVAGTRYCRCELGRPWGLLIPSSELVLFHYVVEGRCLVTTGDKSSWLEAGELIVFPRGDAHVLADAPQRPATDILTLPKTQLGEHSSVLSRHGDAPSTVVLCGGASFVPFHQPLIAHLPPTLRVDAVDQVRAAAELMANEASHPRGGGEVIITRLFDVMLVHAVRNWLTQLGAEPDGWLRAMRDPHLSRALLAMHKQPERRWSVNALASLSLMSRSTFAARFTDMLGESPLAYLTRRRMAVATTLLVEGHLSVDEVAKRVGYDSLPAFSRAYKREVGEPPGRTRSAARPTSTTSPRGGEVVLFPGPEGG